MVINKFNRENKSFKKLFKTNSSQILFNMEKSGDDIPNQAPFFKIKIQEVGVVRENVPIKILDPFYHKELITLNSEIELGVAVGNDKRGVHMSRIGDVIANISQKKFKFVEDCIEEIAIKINETQCASESFVKLTAPFPFYEDVICEGKKPKKSLENIFLHYEVLSNTNNFIFNSGIKFNHITACPCVQQTLKHVLLDEGMSKKEIDDMPPLLTHSQRCATKIIIKNIKNKLNILDLINSVDKSTVRVQNTLPRDYELHMVYEAHKNPQFIEDVVRSLIFNIRKDLEIKSRSSLISIESNSMESIHDFNIKAKIEYSVEELDNISDKLSDLI